MNERFKGEDALLLYQAILKLQTVEECAALFDDLCTVSELKAMVQRLAVARMLYEKQTYSEISLKTGASAATISRVNRYLLYGSDGYKNVLARLQEDIER